jgi:hypothetical protein
MSMQRFLAPAGIVAALAAGGLYLTSGRKTDQTTAAAAKRPLPNSPANPSPQSSTASAPDKPASANPSDPSSSSSSSNDPSPRKDGSGSGAASGTGSSLSSWGYGQTGDPPVKDTRIASGLGGTPSKRAPAGQGEGRRIPTEKAAYRGPEGKDEGVRGDASGAMGGGKR